MSRELTIGLAQLAPQLRDPEANLATVNRVIDEHPEVDLLLFPELFLSGYTTTDLAPLAVPADGPIVERLAAMAKRSATALIVGFAERREADRIANSALCLDRHGAPAGVYRKTHLFGAELEAFTPGDELLVADIDGAKLGIMICFDVEFPEVARALARAGADLLVTISANMTPFGPDHRVFGIARAIENGLPHVYVNQVGRGETFLFTGDSMSVSADGEVSDAAGAEREAVTVTRLTLPAPSAIRPRYLTLLRSPFPDVGATGEG